ncbi:unnamed protein product [Penicillium discolor]
MSHSKKQEKTSDSVKSGGLTPSQTQHLVMSLSRTVFTKARRRLEKWEEQRADAAAIKESEEAGEAEEAKEARESGEAGETGEDEGDNKDSDEAVEAAHAQDAEN